MAHRRMPGAPGDPHSRWGDLSDNPGRQFPLRKGWGRDGEGWGLASDPALAPSPVPLRPAWQGHSKTTAFPLLLEPGSLTCASRHGTSAQNSSALLLPGEPRPGRMPSSTGSPSLVPRRQVSDAGRALAGRGLCGAGADPGAPRGGTLGAKLGLGRRSCHRLRGHGWGSWVRALVGVLLPSVPPCLGSERATRASACSPLRLGLRLDQSHPPSGPVPGRPPRQ